MGRIEPGCGLLCCPSPATCTYRFKTADDREPCGRVVLCIKAFLGPAFRVPERLPLHQRVVSTMSLPLHNSQIQQMPTICNTHHLHVPPTTHPCMYLPPLRPKTMVTSAQASCIALVQKYRRHAHHTERQHTQLSPMQCMYVPNRS